MISRLKRRALSKAIERSDYLRRSTYAIGGLGEHKEWLHFCIHAQDVDMLANFSLVDDMRPGAAFGTEFGRLTVLTRDQHWDGGVERHHDVTARGGEIDITMGNSRVRFDGSRYLLEVHMAERPIHMDLVLDPVTFPAVSNNIRLDDGTPINWALVPRLHATGSVTVGTKHYDLHRALAYHDHNWGHFAWGRDFSWEWCYALPPSPANPWSLVFVRLNDRARVRTYMQGLFLWRQAAPHRVLRGHEIQVLHHGFLEPCAAFKVPRAMALLSPGHATDVPAQIEVRAAGNGDVVEFAFTANDVAQVIIPADCDDTGVTIINEVAGYLSVSGEVRGERLHMAGPSIFEFIRD